MNWRWSLEEDFYVLRPSPLPPGLAEAGFAGRSLRAGGTGSWTGRPAVRLGQVHSAELVWAERPGVLPACDAVRSTVPGLLLTVRTADCLPVVLASPTEGVALVHGGWRGLAAGIVERAAATFTRPAELVALLGPAIGPCCFEVGPEVAAAFPATALRPPLAEKDHVDLFSEARARLVEAGVPAKAISECGICTRCHQHLLHSHRGSAGGPGRIVAFAAASGSVHQEA